VNTPIFASSTFVTDEPGIRTRGYSYGRVGNPTRAAYEACVADLEGGGRGFAFASGLAAAASLLDTLEAGAHVVAMEDLYGGMHRMFCDLRSRSAGLETSFVDLSAPGALEAAIRPETRLIWVETPSNPQLKLVDLAAVALVGRERGILTVVDNTFLSPALQRPLEFGIDVVLHSTTKYVAGHSDLLGGMLVVGDNQPLVEKLEYVQKAIGAVPSPFDCYLCLRSLKTLHLRMERHCANAQTLAEWLNGHPGIESVNYPGLADHPQHALARQQMSGFGGIVTFRPKGGATAAQAIAKRTALFALAVSLGGVESLIEVPALMTHRAVPENVRQRIGLTDDLVRLSLGVEDVDDLIADVSQALEGAV
jgi:cystathionine gamma-lyase